MPAVAIPDIDIVKDGGKVWTDWLVSAQVPEALHEGYGNQRNSIKVRFDMKSEGGVNALNMEDKQAAVQLFDTIAEYGVFVVQKGELENWLEDLGVQGKKTDWTVAMLERLGSDPADSGYVQPAQGDVWDFMKAIVSWVRNPTRKGIA